MLSAIASSCARIHLGVHYPSDCLFGILQGLLSIFIGTIVYIIHLSGLCPSCGVDSTTSSLSHVVGLIPCYAQSEAAANLELASNNFGNINWFLFSVISVGSLIIGVLFVIPPIKFYSKFHHVFR